MCLGKKTNEQYICVQPVVTNLWEYTSRGQINKNGNLYWPLNSLCVLDCICCDWATVLINSWMTTRSLFPASLQNQTQVCQAPVNTMAPSVCGSLPWIHLQMVVTGNCVDFNLFFRWSLYREILINIFIRPLHTNDGYKYLRAVRRQRQHLPRWTDVQSGASQPQRRTAHGVDT